MATMWVTLPSVCCQISGAVLVVVGLPVGLVVELVGEEIAVREFPGHGVGLLDGPVGAPFGRGQQDLGAIGLHDLAALNRGRLRHDQDAPVALGGADHGQADAGVAAGGLEDDLVFGQFAALLTRLDHGQGDPLLDRSTGIAGLQLAVDANTESC